MKAALILAAGALLATSDVQAQAGVVGSVSGEWWTPGFNASAVGGAGAAAIGKVALCAGLQPP